MTTTGLISNVFYHIGMLTYILARRPAYLHILYICIFYILALNALHVLNDPNTRLQMRGPGHRTSLPIQVAYLWPRRMRCSGIKPSRHSH